MPTLYAPGTTPIAVTPRGFVVLGSDTSPALAARIRSLVSDGRGFGGVIEALTGAYGASITAIPSFAVALAEGDAVRIAVRGAFVLDVDAAQPERVSGEGVTTWSERVIPGVVRVALTSGPDAAPAEFPVIDAVVLAASLVWDAVAASALGASRPAGAVSDSPFSDASAARAAAPAAQQDDGAQEQAAASPAAQAESASPAAQAAESASPAAHAAESDAPGAGDAAPASAASVPASPAPSSPPLIDSSAVLSLAETLLPADSTISTRFEQEPAAESGDAAIPTPSGGTAIPTPSVDDSPWEATLLRPAETAAAASGADWSPDAAGDHDGATISLAQARAMRAGDRAFAAPAAPGDAAGSTTPPLAPPRPPAPGRIRMSTGQVLQLDRTVVIGRRPRSTRVSGTDLPHLVAVDSPQQDISRSHVELRVEGESIVATDLRTTNGTTLHRSGVDPVRLHPGEGTVVVPGDLLDLGDGITVVIEALS
ncbi:FHA domain-containing protein [Microbacterium allomyrinae]|uniref:FHA domain-containing protein n=1 Tax=Microbacterium allomyrinae TaxID=2830666 RepID=A0A9X1LWJ2_9MICO|nr:FHA domain-containing protein [Microbacterium allomyrinae]MCC2032991.1 FHA domain-containing protein [Microbacterium allomyrinae]